MGHFLFLSATKCLLLRKLWDADSLKGSASVTWTEVSQGVQSAWCGQADAVTLKKVSLGIQTERTCVSAAVTSKEPRALSRGRMCS